MLWLYAPIGSEPVFVPTTTPQPGPEYTPQDPAARAVPVMLNGCPAIGGVPPLTVNAHTDATFVKTHSRNTVRLNPARTRILPNLVIPKLNAVHYLVSLSSPAKRTTTPQGTKRE